MISCFYRVAVMCLFAVVSTFAQSYYPGKFALKDKLTPAVYSFDLSDVRLSEGRFKQNMLREPGCCRLIPNDYCTVSAPMQAFMMPTKVAISM